MKNKVVFISVIIFSIIYIIVGNRVAMRGDNILKNVKKSEGTRAKVVEIVGETKEYLNNYSYVPSDNTASNIVDDIIDVNVEENQEQQALLQEDNSSENAIENTLTENNELDNSLIQTNDTISTDTQVNETNNNYIVENSYNSEEYTIKIFFKAKILSGPHKGEIVSAYQNISPFLGDNSDPVKKGNKVIISDKVINEYEPKIEFAGKEISWHMETYSRSTYLIILAIVFLALILLFGRLKGVKTLISLVFTVLAIFAVLIPAIIGGQNIYAWTIVTCAFITISTILIVYGYSKKTLATALGCIGGVLVAGLITLFMNQFLKLTGFLDENSTHVYLMNAAIDLKAIIFGGILIGAEGAIMDVAIDISSSLNEVASKMEKPDFSSIVKSGFNIGRDIMGTMTNTLILAYIGSSLATVIALSTSSVVDLLDFEMITVEVLQALAGSIGILTTIPLTSVIAAGLYKYKDMSKYVYKYNGNRNKTANSEK